MANDTCTWPGKSGKKYEYSMHAIGTSFKAEGGNYIFAKALGDGKHRALYVGQTENLRGRLQPSHEKWPCAKQNGMTHIHAHLNASKAARLAEERDLLGNMEPVCND